MHFNPNSPVMRFLDTLWRFVALNVVFVLTCIPLVTIGPSVAALMSTVFAYDDNEDVSLVREYFRRFGREWKYALFSWLIFVAVGLVIAFSLSFWLSMSQLPAVLSYLILAVLIFFAVYLVLVVEWFYPLQVRYDNKWGRLWKLSLQIGWLRAGTSLALIGIDIAAVALAYFSRGFLVLYLIFGFAWIAYAKSLLILRAFDHTEHPYKDDEKPYINAVGA